MRRPLFGNGFPKRALFDDGTIEVFDTADFTPQEGAPLAFAVTLFAWTWQNYQPAPVLANLPTLAVGVSTNGQAAPGTVLAQRYAADVANVQAAQALDVARPVKLLDRFVVRGDQQIYVVNTNANCSVANSAKCFVYGYFEVVGVHIPDISFRPLQPSALVAPFSAPPTLVTIVPPATSLYATAHKLSNTHLDLLDIHADVGGLTAVEGDATTEAFMRFPDGTKLPLPLSAGRILFQSSPFEKQPFRAADANNVNVDVGFDTSGALGNVALSAYGSLLRH